MKKRFLTLLFSVLILACSKKDMEIEYSNKRAGHPINNTEQPAPNPNPDPNPNPTPEPTPEPEPESNPATCTGVASADGFIENWDDEKTHGKTPHISPCWTQESIADSQKWVRKHNGSYNTTSGSYVVELFQNNNDWLFRELSFEKNKYEITIKVARMSSMYQPLLNVKLGKSASASAMTTEIVAPTIITGISGGGKNWQTIKAQFDIPSAGNYVIGLNINSLNIHQTCYIDDISIRKVTNVKCDETSSFTENFDQGYELSSDANPYLDIKDQSQCWGGYSYNPFLAVQSGWALARKDNRPRFSYIASHSGEYFSTITDRQSWLYRAVKLEAGKTYKFSVWVKTYPNSSLVRKFQVSLASDSSKSALENGRQIIPLQNITNTDYVEQKNTFGVSTSGVYYIGIYGDAMGTNNYIAIDDISLTED